MSETATNPSTPGFSKLATALLLGLTLGCAAPVFPTSGRGLGDIVKGPGAIFASVEEAAMDALAWCYTSDRRERRDARVRGGTIQPSEDGYTYARVVTAKRSTPHLVSFALRPTDVASFRHFPETGNLENDRANEFHSARDRANVDRLDPLHRESYLLTPRAVVRVYAGNGREFEIAKLAVWAGVKRGSRHPVITIED